MCIFSLISSTNCVFWRCCGKVGGVPFCAFIKQDPNRKRTGKIKKNGFKQFVEGPIDVQNH
jgi:hypothetical protein